MPWFQACKKSGQGRADSGEQGRGGAQASEMGKVGSKGEGSSSGGPAHLPGKGSSTDHLNFKARGTLKGRLTVGPLPYD